MKKLFGIIAAVALACTALFTSCSYDATYAKETLVTWSNAYAVPADLVKTLKEGDVLKITINPVTGVEYINVGVVTGWWSFKSGNFEDKDGKAIESGAFDGSNWATLKDDDGNYIKEIYFKIDADYASKLKDEGISLCGANYKVCSVEKKK